MVAPPGNQAANGENKPQPAASEETGLLDSLMGARQFRNTIVVLTSVTLGSN